MTDIRESDEAINERGQHRPAFSWPGRRRADEAADAAEKAALAGLERLRGRTNAEPPDAPTRDSGARDELRRLVFEATQQLRDAIKIESNEIGRLVQAQQEALERAIESLQDLTSELKPANPAETEGVSEEEHLLPPGEESVDLNEASHADLR